jgi:ketosteroid isomerase-like protein
MPATEADVTLVREAFQAFSATSEGIEAYFERFFTPDGVVEFCDGFPLTGRYEGVEGYRRFFEESYGPYEDVERRLDEITVEAGTVVALLTITGHERGDDTQLEIQMGNTYEIEGGRIRHLRVYVGHERAREAARQGG